MRWYFLEVTFWSPKGGLWYSCPTPMASVKPHVEKLGPSDASPVAQQTAGGIHQSQEIECNRWDIEPIKRNNFGWIQAKSNHFEHLF